MKNRLYVLTVMVIIIVVLAGCSGSPQPQQPVKQSTATTPTATPAPPATLSVTLDQFKATYNSEIKKRAANSSIIPADTPVSGGVFAFKLSDNPSTQMIGRYETADNKVSSIVFTCDDSKNSGTITRQNISVWTAAIVTATSPKLSTADVDAIVGKLGDNGTLKKDGVFYMVSFENKKAPWLQIIARAEK